MIWIILAGFIQLVSALDLKLVDPINNSTELIFKDSQLQSGFNDTIMHTWSTCSTGGLFIVERNNTFNYESFTLQPNTGSLNDSNITVSCKYSDSFCPTITPSSSNATVNLNCPSEKQINQTNYYNQVSVNIDGLRFTFLVDCDQGVRHKKFEFGYLAIAAINSMVMIGVALHSRIWSYKWRGRQLGIDTTWKWFLPTILVFTGLALLLFKLGVFVLSAKIVGGIISTIFLVIGLNQLVYVVPKMKNKIFWKVRYCDLVSIVAGVTIMAVVEIVTKDFITNDLLAIAVMIGGIKLFKFTSLKQAALCCGMIMTLETIGAVIFHYVAPEKSYNDVFGSDIITPILMQVPSLQRSLYKKCSWVAVTEVIFPGVTVAYLRRFQFARAGRKPYLSTASIAFCASTLIWVGVQAVYPHTLPFAIIVYPITFLAIFLLAVYMNEFKVLFNGTWQDPEFKDNDAYRSILKDNPTVDPLTGSGLMEGLRASSISDKQQLQKKEQTPQNKPPEV